MADISKIDNGTEYNLKDAAARAGIESSKTLKSSVVTVTDAAPINAEDITVDITPKQDLHGYGKPWAGGAGKNKLPMTVAEIKSANTGGTWSGNTYTYLNMMYEIMLDSGSNVTGIKVNGTTTNYPSLNMTNEFTLPTGNYILTPGGVRGRFYKNGAIVADLSAGQSYAFTVSDTNDKYNFVIFTGATTVTNIIAQPMIRLASETDPTFAPYSNICPIEGRTGAELDRVGKNWLNYADFHRIDPNTQQANNQWAVWDNYIACKENELFTVNCGIGNVTIYRFFALCYDGQKNLIGPITTTYIPSNNYTFTINVPDAEYFRFQLYHSSSLADYDFSHAQLERGSTATPYEPYQGQQYTASFGEVVYGGNWHVTEGGTDKTYGYVDLGDCDWAIQSIDGNNCFRTTLQNKTFTENAICSQYSYSPRCRTDETFSTALGAAASLYVRDSRYSDTTAFKTAMSGVQLVYELKTPTTISTPKQNVPMLQGINTVYADCGDTQLKYQPDNVIGELKGEIRAVETELAEVEENLEIVYEDHVANTSMGIIVQDQAVGDMVFSNALDIAKTGYTPIAVTDTSIVHSTVANQGEIATHCLLDVANNRVRFYVHVMDSAASLTIPPNSLTFRVAYKKA